MSARPEGTSGASEAAGGALEGAERGVDLGAVELRYFQGVLAGEAARGAAGELVLDGKLHPAVGTGKGDHGGLHEAC